MSFFGFDTTLPKDRPSRVSRGIFENPDPFAEVARARAEGLHDDNDAYVPFRVGKACKTDSDHYSESISKTPTMGWATNWMMTRMRSTKILLAEAMPWARISTTFPRRPRYRM